MSRTSMMILTLVWAGSAAATNGSPTAVIDWSQWDTLVRAHVVRGQVDYDAIRDDPGFAATVERIATADLAGHGREALLAFYINTYNVLAAQGILNGRSPRSAFGKLKYFMTDKYVIAGEKLSLYGFEHKRIIPLGEPRTHFAIVCASASCPILRSEAYLPSRLETQLNQAAREFINDTDENSFDLEEGNARVSKIFKWFRDEFETNAGSVGEYLAQWVEDPDLRRALEAGELKIKFQAYDWSLNGTFSKR
jgi:hypothetical protein